jgi:hypothetical protein
MGISISVKCFTIIRSRIKPVAISCHFLNTLPKFQNR